MDGFNFQSPPKIVFGWGSAAQLAAEASRFGSRPLVVCGNSLRSSGALLPLLERLRQARLVPTVHEGVPAEPGVDALQACMDAVDDADCVIAIGGGSAIDIGKAAAALAGTSATARDYWNGLPVPDRGRPIIAVPTTSGTGSEVTWVTVLVDKGSRRKASIRGPGMMPTVAMIDPQLTVSCPARVTANSGMDAWVQAVEAFTSRGANPLTDGLALQAAKLAWRWLPLAVAEPQNQDAREGMALASTMAGMALNTSRLGLVHGLAHPLGAVTGAAHGLICGLLMPAVIRYNAEVSGSKYALLCSELGECRPDTPDAGAGELLALATERRLRELGIPGRLTEIGFDTADLDWVAAETMPSGSTKANPRLVSVADARRVAETCV